MSSVLSWRRRLDTAQDPLINLRRWMNEEEKKRKDGKRAKITMMRCLMTNMIQIM